MRVLPVLKRFDVYVYKNKGTNDAAQVPASASISFHKQGATAKASASLEPPTDPDEAGPPVVVPVYSVGAIALNDVFRINDSQDKMGVVQGVDTSDPSSQTLTLANVGFTAFTIGVGDRLVIVNDPPEIYSDPVGTVPIGTSIDTSALTGRATGYVRAYRFDYVVTVSALDKRLFVDAEGSFVMR